MKKSKFFSARNIAYLAVLLALVIVLQLIGTLIGNLGVTAPSLVLIPIVLGAILLGPVGGGFLGFAFGLVVVLAGVFGMDKFTFILFSDHPFLTVLLCLVKGTAAGAAAGLLFKVLREKKRKRRRRCRVPVGARRQYGAVYSRGAADERYAQRKLRCGRADRSVFPHRRLRRAELYL